MDSEEFERRTGKEPKGECLPCPHVHCEFCEFVLAIVPDPVEGSANMFIHIRDEHREEWLADPEFARMAIQFGVESI